MQTRCVAIALVSALMLAVDAHAQAMDSAKVAAVVKTSTDSAVAQALARFEANEERKKVFKIGASVGWRHVVAKGASLLREVSLNPETHVVTADKMDQGDVVISAVITAFPWKKPETASACCAKSQAWRVGFIANVALASFGDEGVNGFNKSVEGGLGLAYRLSDDFALAGTVERKFSRQLRGFVEVGKELPVAAGTTPTLDRSDNTYFRDDNLTALSFKFVYFIR